MSIINRLQFKKPLSPEFILLASCIYFTVIFNLPFWRSVTDYLHPLSLADNVSILLIAVVICCLHFLLLVTFIHSKVLKPLLSILFFTGASAGYYSWYYSTYFDVSMINNILETDRHESTELITVHFLLFLLVTAGIPSLLLTTIKIRKSPCWTTVKNRIAFSAVIFSLLVVSLLISFQAMSSLMRNHKELRYLINPGNVLVGLPRALTGKAANAQLTKQALDTDVSNEIVSKSGNPRLLVLVVGETLRAANWGLNGYERNTTPQLSKQAGVINFPAVSSCGTSTSVSLPCMFSGQPQEDYTEPYAHSHESLLNLAQRAGIDVEWIDNQSGCKGVCDGVETDKIKPENFLVECPDGTCMDAVLNADLKNELDEEDGNQLLVIHMMGSHGPAYFRRYPENIAQFTPTCDTEELSSCDIDSIRNSYDNSVLYTDLVLSAMIDQLRQDQRHETAMIFVSDHGESLGEMGIYLHGLPYFVAPEEQKKVPMVWWLSPSFKASTGISDSCLNEIATRPASHDNLFHTVLGLMDIKTTVYDPASDLSKSCRRG
jgi:lipid A ethanolaminephosphotransferase